MEGACALGLGAAAPQAMVGAKAAGHHGVPETNPSLETSSKKLSSAARRSTVQFYVRQRKKRDVSGPGLNSYFLFTCLVFLVKSDKCGPTNLSAMNRNFQ